MCEFIIVKEFDRGKKGGLGYSFLFSSVERKWKKLFIYLTLADGLAAINFQRNREKSHVHPSPS